MVKSSGDNRNFTPKEPPANSGAGRHSMTPAQSKRHFAKHAMKTHKANLPSRLPMRGGIRF